MILYNCVIMLRDERVNMDNKVQEFIKKKKRKKILKKIGIIVPLLMATTAGILLKASFFNIDNIKLSGNLVLEKNSIINEKEILGQNIFLFNQKDLEKIILSNSYIEGVTIKKQLPDGLNIEVEERKMVYKIKEEGKNYIVNKSLVLMEIKDEVEGLSLIELQGIKVENKVIGESITKDKNKIKVAETLGDKILNKENEELLIDGLEINDINKIILKKDNIKIMLGDLNDLEKKYNKAINILKSDEINIENGYIDVSFEGNPVIKEEQTKKDDEIKNQEEIKGEEN